MKENPGKKYPPPVPFPELGDEDILEAMKAIPGYLDISPADFKEIYRLAFEQAMDRISRSVKARHIMTRDVLKVKEDSSLVDLAQAMGRKKISGVPVVDETGRVKGIISEKDFLKNSAEGSPTNVMSFLAQCLEVKTCLTLPLREQKAGDIMSSPAITVREEMALKEIMELFSTHSINRVPVVDSERRLIGIITRNDLLKANSLSPGR